MQFLVIVIKFNSNSKLYNMARTNIFMLVNEYEDILRQLEESEGELTPELEEALKVNEDEVAKKLTAYHQVIQLLKAEAKVAKDEADRLSNVKKVKENTVKRIHKYVNLALEVFGTTTDSGTKKIDLGSLKIWQKKGESLNVAEDFEVTDPRFITPGIHVDLRNIEPETLDTLNALLTGADIQYEPANTVNNALLKEWVLVNKYRKQELEILTSKLDGSVSDEDMTAAIADLTILKNVTINESLTPIFK